MNKNRVAPVASCPSVDALKAYALGQQPKKEMELIDKHVSTCKQCETALAKLDSKDDSLMQRLRLAKAPAASTADSAGAAKLVAGAKAITRAKPVPAATRSPSVTVHFPGYEILETLGQGGCGTVYKVRNVRMGGRTEALKTIKDPGDLGLRARFRQEITAVAQLEHPNIIRAYDTGEANGLLYLTMEFAAGCDLHKLVKQRGGPIPAAEACTLICQAADGLQSAHDKSIIHRDVKPGNLILTQEGYVKVLDLGLARLVGQTDRGAPLTGGFIGTQSYAAPEQLADTHTVTAAADIYSLGCTLYFLLAGRNPSPGRLEIPHAALQPILDRMVAARPENRYPSMGAVIADLSPFRFIGPVALETMQTRQAPAAGVASASASTATQAQQTTAKPAKKPTLPAPATATGAPPTQTASNGPASNPTQEAGSIGQSAPSFVRRYRYPMIGAGAFLMLSCCVLAGVITFFLTRPGDSAPPMVIFDSGPVAQQPLVVMPGPGVNPLPPPPPPSAEVKKTIAIERPIQSANASVRVTLDKVDLLSNKRVRWHFTLQNESTAAVNFSVVPTQSYAIDNLGDRKSGIEHSIKGSAVVALPPGQKIDYWIDFHEPGAGATSLTAHFGGGLPALKVNLFGPQPRERIIPVNRPLQTWDDKVEVILESVELLPESRMRWRLSFFNKSSNKRTACSISPDLSFVTDQNGKTFASLGVSHGANDFRQEFQILEGQRIADYWIDFDGPSPDSRKLIAHFGARGGPGRLPKEVTVLIDGGILVPDPMPTPNPVPDPTPKKPVDLSGRWVGTLSQEGIDVPLTFEIVLTQSGKDVSGKTSLVGKRGTKAAEFAGTLDGVSLDFRETKFLNVMPAYPLIKGDLKLVTGDDMSMTLVGPWQALTGRGQIRLEKKK